MREKPIRLREEAEREDAEQYCNWLQDSNDTKHKNIAQVNLKEKKNKKRGEEKWDLKEKYFQDLRKFM